MAYSSSYGAPPSPYSVGTPPPISPYAAYAASPSPSPTYAASPSPTYAASPSPTYAPSPTSPYPVSPSPTYGAYPVSPSPYPVSPSPTSPYPVSPSPTYGAYPTSPYPVSPSPASYTAGTSFSPHPTSPEVGSSSSSSAPFVYSTSAPAISVPLLRQYQPVSFVGKPLDVRQSRAIVKEQGRKDISNWSELQEYVTKTVSFDYLSYQEMSELKVVTITNGDTKGTGSVNDPIMRSDASQICEYAPCRSASRCPTHPGLIDFGGHLIPSPLLIGEIIDILEFLCNTCSCPYVAIEVLRRMKVATMKNKRVETLKRLSGPATCLSSGTRRVLRGGAVQECESKMKRIYKKKKSMERGEIIYELPGGGKDNDIVLPIEEAFAIVHGLSDENAHLLGYRGGHPRNFFLRAIMVFSPIFRLPTRIGSEVTQHYLTKQYIIIFNASEALKNYKSNNQPIKDLRKKLYDAINGLYKNESHLSPTIGRLLTGKKGLMRFEIMGTRQEHAGRTVAAPGPTLAWGEIGIPRSMTPILQPEDTVTKTNLIPLQEMLDKGQIYKVKLPHDTKFPTLEGEKIPRDEWIETAMLSVPRLYPGMKVRRMMRTGDPLIHGRNPSLTAQSQRCGRARVEDIHTFKHNLYYTPIYGSDFDGDECGILILKSVRAIADALVLMGFDKCIISLYTSKPAIGLVYDAIQGLYHLTDKNTIVDSTFFYDAIVNMEPGRDTISIADRAAMFGIGVFSDKVMMEVRGFVEEGERREEGKGERKGEGKGERRGEGKGERREEGKGERKEEEGKIGEMKVGEKFTIPLPIPRKRKNRVAGFPGRLLFSMLLPEDFFYTKGKVTIVDGIHIQGQITKEHIGVDEARTIIHSLFIKYGPKRTALFIAEATRLATDYITYRGGTVGLQDCRIADERSRREMKAYETTIMEEIEAFGAVKTELESQYIEQHVVKRLSGLPGSLFSAVQRVAAAGGNNIVEASSKLGSGAKGSLGGLITLGYTVGQTYVEGGRAVVNRVSGTVHPAFDPGSKDLASRGFIRESYLTGLSPESILFESMSTRNAMIKMQNSTPEMGDMAHMLAKVTEGMVIAPDGSTITSSKTILSAVYGGDGYEANKLIAVPDVDGEDIHVPIDVESLIISLNADAGWIMESMLVSELPKYPTIPIITSQRRQRPSVKESPPTAREGPPAERELLPFIPRHRVDLVEWEAPGLSRFAKARAIAARMESLDAGDMPLIEVDPTVYMASHDIALGEYDQGVLPVLTQVVHHDGRVDSVPAWRTETVTILNPTKVSITE